MSGALERGSKEFLMAARDAALKISDGKEATKEDLEAIFTFFDRSKDFRQGNNTIQQDYEKVIDLIRKGVDIAVDATSDYFINVIKNGKKSFSDIVVSSIQSGDKDLESLLTDPCKLLKDTIELNDEASGVLNDILLEKIYTELKDSNSYQLNNLDTDELHDILDKIKSLGYIEEEVKDVITNTVSNCLIGKISPQLEKYVSDFTNKVNEAITKHDIDFDVKSCKEEFSELVREAENNYIVRGSEAESLLNESKDNFESQFDSLVGKLVMACIDNNIAEDLDNFDSSSEIDYYIKGGGNSYGKVTDMISELNDSEIIEKLNDLLEKKIDDARVECNSKPPKVKTVTENDGHKYALFGGEEFPVRESEEKKHRWKMIPKALPNGNILITFKDLTSGTVIEPDPTKRFRYENPYEISVEEWKNIQKLIKEEAPEALKNIEEIKKELKVLTKKAKENPDDNEIKEEIEKVQGKLSKEFEKIPHCLGVLKRLTWLNQSIGDYIENKVPDFDPNTTKITPAIMEELREVAECAKTMLLGQKDILIIEGEAGVGKNVLIDIFAHYTNRPVFVFACGKKTDSHDLTYLRILDESGSKKLNSKIFEAIRTPGAILVLDEINTMDAGIQKRLNALFDRRKQLVTDEAGVEDGKALPDVLLFATMNPVSYEGTQKLADDVASRAHFIPHDYDWLINNGNISYSDALIIYGNVNYFWKLLTGNGMKKQDVELYEIALLNEKLGNKLTKQQKESIEKFKPISDSEFIWAWNQMFNNGNTKEVAKRFGEPFVEGMNDIYTIVLYSNYIRVRHKIANFGIGSGMSERDLPWKTEDDDLFREKSFSPRLAIQALEQLNNGNEISGPKDAVIQTYVQQVSNEETRTELIDFFKTNSKETLEEHLRDRNVQSIIFK